MIPGTRESDIRKAIADLLAAKGFHVERRNTGARTWKDKNGRKRLVKFAKTGQADLYGWDKKTGRHFECEVKKPGEVPSDEQSMWLNQCAIEGVISFWADSVEMAEKALKTYGY